jgi:transcriptional regulator with XRE-family HTH domain
MNKAHRYIPKPTHFGKNLKFLRRLSKLSQTELASRLGINRNNIASYESGMVEPDANRFLKICVYFKKDPQLFLETLFSEEMISKGVIVYTSKNKEIDHLQDKLLSFIAKTNEMTKIYEGYKAYYEMQNSRPDIQEINTDLIARLDSILELLGTSIATNWKLIHSLMPTAEEEE